MVVGEKASEAIKGVVGERTLAIVCQGPSAPFVTQVGDPAWCYASINRASLVENLCPRPLELVYCTSGRRLDQEAAWLDRFQGLVVSGKNAGIRLKRYFERDDDGPYHYRGRANTLSAFLFCLMKASIRDIVLFGCDGSGGTYYRADCYKNECNDSVYLDSLTMNKSFWTMAKRYAPNWTGSVLLAHPERKTILNCFPIVDAAGLRAQKPLTSA